MAIHIVTSRCFLACEKVLSVKIEDYPRIEDEDVASVTKPKPVKKKGKKAKKTKPAEPLRDYRITIGYYPAAINSQAPRNYDSGEYMLELAIRDKEKAYKVYSEIVREVQEQHPTEGYLDKLVGQMLASDEFIFEENSDVSDGQE